MAVKRGILVWLLRKRRKKGTTSLGTNYPRGGKEKMELKRRIDLLSP